MILDSDGGILDVISRMQTKKERKKKKRRAVEKNSIDLVSTSGTKSTNDVII